MRILLIEDSPIDVDFIRSELQNLEDSFTLEVVDTKPSLVKALKAFNPEIVLSDFYLPTLDAFESLKIVRRHDPDLPFIVVTGSINEETAADCIKAGANDYVTKEHLARLIPAIHNALDAAQSRRELAVRDQILHVVNVATSTFLKNPPWTKSIDSILAQLGNAAGVDRAYLFQNSTLDDSTLVSSQRFEWVCPTVEPQIDNPELQDIPWEATGFGRWLKRLQAGRPVHGPIQDFPKTEQPLLEAQAIQSLLVVPIMVEEELWGFIGFDDCTTARTWETAIIEALYTAANAIGSAITREQTEEALTASQKKYEDLYNNAPDLYSTIDTDGIIRNINRSGAEMLGYRREELIGQPLTMILDPETQERFYKEFPTMVRNKTEANLIGKYRHKSGTVIWFDLRNTWEVNEDGNARFSHGIGRNITETIENREQVRKLSQAVEYSPVGVAITDNRGGHIEYVNKQFVRNTGYSLEDIQGQTMTKLDSGVHDEQFYLGMVEAIQSGETWQGEMCIRQKSGNLCWNDLHIAPLFDEGGNITHFIAAFTDISERKKEEEELRDYRQNLEKMVKDRTEELAGANKALENTLSTMVSVMESPKDIVIFSLDRAYCYTSFNENHKNTIRKIWGVDIAIGMNMLDIIKDSADREKAKRNFDRALNGDKFTEIEEYGEPPNRFYYEDRYNPIIDEHGNVTGLTLFLSDITERIKAQEELANYQSRLEDMVAERTAALKESEERYRGLIESAPLAIGIHQNGKWQSLNAYALRMLGYEDHPGDIIGHSIFKIVHPDFKEQIKKRVEQELKMGQPAPPVEEKLVRADGSVVEALVTAVPIQIKGKTAFMVSAVDLTPVKETQRALAESEHRYRSIFENSQDVIGISNFKGRMLDINPAAESILGYSTEEILNMNITDLYNDPSDGRRFFQIIREKGHVNNFHTLFRRKDGAVIEALMSAAAQYDASGQIETFQGVIRDVTAFNEANRRWETLRHLVRQLAEPLELKEIGPIVARRAYELFEYDAFNLDMVDDENQMLVGLYNEDILPGSDKPVPVPTNDIPLGSVRKKSILKGEMKCMNRRRLPKNSPINVFGSKRLSRSLLYAPIKREEKVIGALSVQSYTLNKYSKEDLPLLETFANHITGAIRRARQRKILMDALEKAQEGERTKSMFLANMSHEIRTPLNSILGFTGIIEDKFSRQAEPEELEWFESVRASGERLMNTVHSILEISQLEAGTMAINKKRINLVACMNQVARELKSRADERKLDLIIHTPVDKAVTVADEYCITQAISNLVENAIKYTNQGRVELSLRRGEDNWKVVIKDTGIGISKDYMSHMYTAFSQASEGFTKKYQGIGLGLALTKKYLDLNDVEISVRSRLNVGTTFTLTFPVSDVAGDKAEKRKTGKKKLSLPRGISHVLVVEDDEMSRRLADVLLRKKFNLSYAESVSEAKRVLQRSPIDLVLLDLSLKGEQDGLKLALWMRKQKKWEKTPIIVVSAHALEEDKDKALAAGCNDFVTKPIMWDELHDTLAKFGKTSNK
ncbi:MAG: PAS domain S-box protein [Fidelibacterota bacterium]